MLLIDAGNSRIKWAYLFGGTLRGQGSAAHERAMPAALMQEPAQAVFISSVAGDDFNRRLQRWLERGGHGPCTFAVVKPDSFGLRLAYRNPAKLGVDRWLAMVAGRDLAPGAVCVADAGTALTIDAVTADGQHLGGLIAPGPSTMMRSMLKDTARIRETGDPATLTEDAFFAADTGAAVAAGAAFSAASLIDRAVRLLSARVKSPVTLLLTGGEAPALARLVEAQCKIVPDLVLMGIAKVAGQHLHRGEQS